MWFLKRGAEKLKISTVNFKSCHRLGHLRQGHLSKPEELRAAAGRDGHLPVQGGRLPHPGLPGLPVRVSPGLTGRDSPGPPTETRQRFSGTEESKNECVRKTWSLSTMDRCRLWMFSFYFKTQTLFSVFALVMYIKKSVWEMLVNVLSLLTV